MWMNGEQIDRSSDPSLQIIYYIIYIYRTRFSMLCSTLRCKLSRHAMLHLNTQRHDHRPKLLLLDIELKSTSTQTGRNIIDTSPPSTLPTAHPNLHNLSLCKEIMRNPILRPRNSIHCNTLNEIILVAKVMHHDT